MKIKFGGLARVDGGASEEIVVKSSLLTQTKDILIGGGMILLGVGYLCCAAFKNGVDETAKAEQRAYKNTGCLNEYGWATVITPDLANQLKGEE